MDSVARAAPARPLLYAATAAAAGSALGASGALTSSGARVVCLLVPFAWAVAVLLRATPRRRAELALLALLVGGFALRSHPTVPTRAEGTLPSAVGPGPLASTADSTPSQESKRGEGGARRSSAQSTGVVSVGTWRRTGGSRDGDRGRLEPAGTSVLVPRGSLGDGESVASLAREAPPSWARGPEPGPSRRRGIERPPAALAADELVRVSLANESVGTRVAAPLESVRERLLERLRGLDDERTRGLVAGLLFGDLTQLPDGVGDLFVRTGTFHILAISGLQVALVAVFVAAPLAELLSFVARIALRALAAGFGLRALTARLRLRAFARRITRRALPQRLLRRTLGAHVLLRALAARVAPRPRAGRVDPRAPTAPTPREALEPSSAKPESSRAPTLVRAPSASGIRAALLLLFVPIAGAGPPVTRSALAWTVGSLAGGLPARIPFGRRRKGAARAGRLGVRAAGARVHDTAVPPSAGEPQNLEGSPGEPQTRGSPDDPQTRESGAGELQPLESSAESLAERSMPRAADALSLWSLALLCECLAHPAAALSLSVQLSYAATLGLIVCTGPIVRRLRALARDERTAAAAISAAAIDRGRPALARIVIDKVRGAVLAAIGASLAAVLATAPFAWSSFGEWSPAGILATPAIAPGVAWLLVAGWLWLALPAAVPQILLDVPARSLLATLEWFDRIPGTPTLLPPRHFALVAGAAALAIYALSRPALARSERPRTIAGALAGRRSAARIAALAFAAALLPWSPAPRGLEVHALDVGNGTAVVLRAPSGEIWVFDAGSRDRPDVDREALGPLLRRFDAARLGVVLSHADKDHDGALAWLVERLPPQRWVGALPAHLRVRLPHTVARADVGAGRIRLAGLHTDSALTLEVSRGLASDDNEGSRTLEVAFAGRRIVLCGDAEAEGLSAWLRGRTPAAALPGTSGAGPDAPDGGARLLLLPHHGSETEGFSALLRHVQPDEVWISASGVPEIVRELERRSIPTRCTGRDGPLRLELP